MNDIYILLKTIFVTILLMPLFAPFVSCVLNKKIIARDLLVGRHRMNFWCSFLFGHIFARVFL